MSGMDTLKTFTKTVFLLTAITGVPSVADASKAPGRSRIAHAKELLGRNAYKRSTARKSEGMKDMTEFVERMTEEWLPERHSKKSTSVANAIVREAERWGFDPIFLLAIIQNESRFNPDMRGNHGEIGLMQVKPSTAEWVGKKMKVRYRGDKSLFNPVENIRMGAAYMALLRDQFDSHSRLYISAYNMGAAGVRRIVAEDKMPKEYVQAVMKRYVAIYSAFEAEDAHEDLDELTDRALTRVRDVTREAARDVAATKS
jgi:soluble lytic murein transglycosylase